MKQFIKLIVLMLIGLVLNGCYSAQQEKAIEMCKRKYKYLEVIDTSSLLEPDRIDTMTFKVCYTSRPANRVDTIVSEVCGRDLTNSVSESFEIYEPPHDNLSDDFRSSGFRIDSIRTYTTSHYIHEHTRFRVTYSYKNDYFEVPHLDSREFLIINDQVLCLDDDDWWDSNVAAAIETVDTISVNRFINNSPDKIFKSEDEVKEYLNNFESNFKLKN